MAVAEVISRPLTTQQYERNPSLPIATVLWPDEFLRGSFI